MNKKFISVVAILVMAAFYYLIYFNYVRLHYLGPPFFFISNDSFMDFFNTNWHSQNNGKAFTDWYSIYSPLNLFLSSRIVSSECLGIDTPINLRLCDLSNFFIICILSYLLLILLILLIQIKERKFSLFTFILPISFPVLYAYERGNYVVLAAILVTLSLLTENRVIKIILVSICINIKIYILFPVIYSMNSFSTKKKTIYLFLFVIVLLFLFGAYVYGDEKWYLYFKNLIAFNGNVDSYQTNWLPTSLNVYKIYKSNDIFGLILQIISIIIKVVVLLKLYLIYINKANINEDLLFCISFLGMSILMNIGYYSYIIILPYFIKLDISNKISNYSFFLICCLVIPIGIYEIKYFGSIVEQSFIYSYFIDWMIVKKELYVTVNSILIPLVSFLLFTSFTNDLRYRRINE